MPDGHGPPKEHVELFGEILSNMVFGLTGFGPSMQTCKEFARRIMAEARQEGSAIKFEEIINGKS